MATATRSKAPASPTLPPKPEHSLGLGVYLWCQHYIRQPDGPDAGEPWRFTAEQIRFLHYMYAVDELGRFRFHRAVLRRAKGWGKSPFMAAIALAELCGPVRFDGFDAEGEPVGAPTSMPWVQIAGVSEKQTANTMSMVLAMIGESPIIDDFGLDPGLTRIYAHGGGKLEPITASAPTAEGARPSFVVMDETHHWLANNGGHKLAEVIRRNLGKSRDGAARSVETTNAHEPGLDSVAERSFEAWSAAQSGRTRRDTLLYDAREAPAEVDLADEAALMKALEGTYGDSDWVDLDRIAGEIYDPGTPPDVSRRFYLNQIVAAQDAWVAPHEWDACADATLSLHDGDEIALGFDGSRTDDATALVACRLDDGALFLLHVQEAPNDHRKDGWEVDRTLVDGAVRAAFDRFEVAAFYSDVHPWESYVDAWSADFGPGLAVKASERSAVGFDMRSKTMLFTRAAEAFAQAIADREIRHDGDTVLRQHVHNARRRPNRFGVGLGKEHRESARKVDAAVAAILARAARTEAVIRGRKKQLSGRVWA
jgi:phage terminase large subunit-like protein